MTFNYLRRIYLSDTDAAGVVYFARGLEICHEAYEESLAEAGIDLNQMIQGGTTALPIVHGEIDFFRPLFCGDRIEISLEVNLVNGSQFAIDYQISSVDNSDKILIKAKTRHVCLNPQIRQRIDLPATILEWVKSYQ